MYKSSINLYILSW